MAIEKELMQVLACPRCKSSVKENGMFIVCSHCKLAYPVLNGKIPDMLMEDSWGLEKAKRVKFKHTLRL